MNKTTTINRKANDFFKEREYKKVGGRLNK